MSKKVIPLRRRLILDVNLPDQIKLLSQTSNSLNDLENHLVWELVPAGRAFTLRLSFCRLETKAFLATIRAPRR